jgi:putative transposase
VSTVAELASQHKVHANQITQWKKQAENALPEVFGSRKGDEALRQEELTDRLYQQIGQLKVELDWLKKKSGLER